jgi:hypothetical protein
MTDKMNSHHGGRAHLLLLALILLAVMALGIAALRIGLSNPSSLMLQGCGETTRRSIPSPGNQRVAALLERNCGATTDYVTHVNLRDARQKFLVAQDGTIRDGCVLILSGRVPVQVTWTDSRHLTLTYSEAEPAFLKERSWRDIAISHRTTR